MRTLHIDCDGKSLESIVYQIDSAHKLHQTVTLHNLDIIQNISVLKAIIHSLTYKDIIHIEYYGINLEYLFKTIMTVAREDNCTPDIEYVNSIDEETESLDMSYVKYVADDQTRIVLTGNMATIRYGRDFPKEYRSITLSGTLSDIETSFKEKIIGYNNYRNIMFRFNIVPDTKRFP